MYEFFTSLPPEIKTFLLSMTPVGELRLSIPWAINFYDFSVTKSFLISFIGNNVINLILFYLASPVADWLEKQRFFLGKFVAWVREHLESKGQKYLEKWGSLAILIICSIPLPGFGGWTGAGIAAFMGISSKKAVPSMIIGTLVSAIIVTLTTLGIVNI